MPFRVTASCTSTGARVGLLQTAHGVIETPAFMPVGTQGSVKALSPDELVAAGAQCILGNTYHLALRPGGDLLERLGGLHQFMSWSGPILTDSGGFQVMSLSQLRRVDDDGVWFRSHLDGTEHYFTPERVVHLQHQIGSDIAMVLDECVAYPCAREQAVQALRRTHAWAARSRAAHRDSGQLLFAIVQGATFSDLRRESAVFLAGLDFHGYALGGVSVGEPRPLTCAVLEATIAHLPPQKPRYLMGVGAPIDLVEYVGYGIDLFDCVLPTRLGRNAAVFSSEGRLSLRQARYAADDRPIDEACQCEACLYHSRAYLHYLFRVDEPLAHRLASLHNVTFLLTLMQQIRAAIQAGAYEALRARWLALEDAPPSDGVSEAGLPPLRASARLRQPDSAEADR